MGCAEYLLMQVAMQTVLRYGHIEQGNIGEQIASELCTQHLNMSNVGYMAVKHGLDGVFGDKQGNTVVVESKCEATTGFPTLNRTPKGEDQMSDAWISTRADLMQNQNSSQHSERNSQIGKDIINARDNGSLRCVLVHTNPETGEVRAYERTSSENVRSSSSWQLIGSWKEN